MSNRFAQLKLAGCIGSPTREPESRVYCGTEPEKLTQISTNQTKYINKIKLGSNEPSDEWFDDEILLNPELVSIIGNKGSGKSALSDIIGLLGNSRNFKYFSFLNDKKFHLSNACDKHYGKIFWQNNETEPDKTISLKDSVKNDEIERVRYIPQSYFEKVCNLVDDQQGFKREIEKVIFKHLTEEQRQDAEDFGELVKIKNDLIKKEIESLTSDLFSVIEDYVDNDTKLLTEIKNLNKSTLNEYSNQKLNIEAELLALEKDKINKPNNVETSNNIQIITEKIAVEEKNSTDLKNQLNTIIQTEYLIQDLMQRINLLKQNYDSFKNEIYEILSKLNINEKDGALFITTS